jgi:hypothetical protein
MTPGMTPYAVASGETWLCPPWAITPAARIATRTCRSCGARVAWLKTIKTGSLAPVNPDGISHFATCPQAPAWRKPKAVREEAAL